MIKKIFGKILSAIKHIGVFVCFVIIFSILVSALGIRKEPVMQKEYNENNIKITELQDKEEFLLSQNDKKDEELNEIKKKIADNSEKAQSLKTDVESIKAKLN